MLTYGYLILMWWDRIRASLLKVLSVVMKIVTLFIIITIINNGPKIVAGIKASADSLITTMKSVLVKIDLRIIWVDLIINLMIIGMLVAITVTVDFVDRHYRHE
ncbi:MAG: hypothetical protein QXU28_02305 [Nitrososphaerota archaeon]